MTRTGRLDVFSAVTSSLNKVFYQKNLLMTNNYFRITSYKIPHPDALVFFNDNNATETQDALERAQMIESGMGVSSGAQLCCWKAASTIPNHVLEIGVVKLINRLQNQYF